MTLKSVAMFEKMAPLLESQGASIVAKVGAAYHFELRAKKGDQPTYVTVDLKSGNGKITVGKEGRADATFVMLDDDFMKLVGGKLKAQDAFMNGKMKIKGNMAKAMKFNPSVLPKGAKL
mgnify:CR=1 FL=1